MRDRVVGVRVNASEGAFFDGQAQAYGLSTPELLRVIGLLFSDLARQRNVGEGLLGQVLKAIAINDISAADVLAELSEPELDVEHRLTQLLRTGHREELQTAS